MKEEGLPEKKVLRTLQQIRGQDLSYDRIFSSMCTRPHPIALKAHRLFQETNLGDPGLFPGSAKLEQKVVEMMADLLGCPSATGYLSTGGTESNIQAIRTARNACGIDGGNIVVPKSAHFSFDKIGDILRLDIRKADLDETLKVDPDSVDELIDNKTIALVGIAGTTEFGQVDPIDRLGELALDHGLHLHVDAAFGGFVLPFLRGDWKWDFRVESVSSITIDPHKMGMSTIPGGILLFRDHADLDRLAAYAPYLTVARPTSLSGTRSGAAAAAIWAVMTHLGREGFVKVIRHCMDLSRRLVTGTRNMGVDPVIEPVMNVVALKVESPKEVQTELAKCGWRVSITQNPKALRLVLMPHTTKENVDLFLRDLEALLKK
ncbi:MAG: tyrosine decarboxylase MfnA [Methanotrichaceae archaeon]